MINFWTQIGITLLHLSYWFSIQAFGLSVFRYRILDFKKQLIICSIILTLLSIILQSLKLVYLISSIQPLCFFLCICLFYHIKPINSLLIVVIPYSIDTVLESTFNMLKSNFSFYEFVEIYKNEYIIQGFLLVIINLLITVLLKKYRFGFTFLSKNNQEQLIKPKFSLKYYAIILCGAGTTAAVSLALVHLNQILMALLTLILIILITIVNLMFKKETEEIDS